MIYIMWSNSCSEEKVEAWATQQFGREESRRPSAATCFFNCLNNKKAIYHGSHLKGKGVKFNRTGCYRQAGDADIDDEEIGWRVYWKSFNCPSRWKGEERTTELERSRNCIFQPPAKWIKKDGYIWDIGVM